MIVLKKRKRKKRMRKRVPGRVPAVSRAETVPAASGGNSSHANRFATRALGAHIRPAPFIRLLHGTPGHDGPDITLRRHQRRGHGRHRRLQGWTQTHPKDGGQNTRDGVREQSIIPALTKPTPSICVWGGGQSHGNPILLFNKC